MTAEELTEIVRSAMPAELYTKPGAVLATSISTVKPSTVYIMGINPGGDPCSVGHTTPIIEAICAREGTSAYTHECWRSDCKEAYPCRHIGSDGLTLPDARVRHQNNMVALTRALGGTPASIVSVNAIFGRSSKLAALQAQTRTGKHAWWEACWPVHQRLLAIVRPRLIVTLGYGENSSAFGLLRAKAGASSYRKFSHEGRRGGWAFEASLNLPDGDLLDTTVVGVPHPSYHAPGPVLSEMLTECSTGLLGA